MKRIETALVLAALTLTLSTCTGTPPVDELILDMQYTSIINTAIADLKTHSKLSLLNGHVAINISSGSRELDGQFAENLQKAYPNFASKEDTVNREELYQMTVKVYREGEKVLVNSIVTNFQDTKIVERTVTIEKVSVAVLESVQYQTSTAARNEFEAYLDSTFGSVGDIAQEVWIKPKQVSWTAVRDSPFGEGEWSSIVYGGGRFVAGRGGTIAYSVDGITWTVVGDSPFKSNWIHSIAYGGGRFIAVGGGTIAYSVDGITWTVVGDSPFKSNWIHSIVYGGGRFIAVGGDTMAYSVDGKKWKIVHDSPFKSNRIRSIAYGGGRFVAVGENGTIAYSTDGITWTEVRDTTLINKGMISSIAYGGGRFVAVSSVDEWRSLGTIAYSADGITWTEVRDSTLINKEERIRSIVYGGGRFVAVGYGIMAYSADGITWTWTAVRDSPFKSNWLRSIAYGGGRFVAMGYNGTIAYFDLQE
jgi:hypothetical protein